MELKELRDFLAREMTYPNDTETVREEVGDTEISAPNEADTETITELLDGVTEEVYSSPDELFETILTRLPDQYVGRKYYDDRGGNGPEIDSARTDEKNQSF